MREDSTSTPVIYHEGPEEDKAENLKIAKSFLHKQKKCALPQVFGQYREILANGTHIESQINMQDNNKFRSMLETKPTDFRPTVGVKPSGYFKSTVLDCAPQSLIGGRFSHPVDVVKINVPPRRAGGKITAPGQVTPRKEKRKRMALVPILEMTDGTYTDSDWWGGMFYMTNGLWAAMEFKKYAIAFQEIKPPVRGYDSHDYATLPAALPKMRYRGNQLPEMKRVEQLPELEYVPFDEWYWRSETILVGAEYTTPPLPSTDPAIVVRTYESKLYRGSSVLRSGGYVTTSLFAHDGSGLETVTTVGTEFSALSYSNTYLEDIVFPAEYFLKVNSWKYVETLSGHWAAIYKQIDMDTFVTNAGPSTTGTVRVSFIINCSGVEYEIIPLTDYLTEPNTIDPSGGEVTCLRIFNAGSKNNPDPVYVYGSMLNLGNAEGTRHPERMVFGMIHKDRHIKVEGDPHVWDVDPDDVVSSIFGGYIDDFEEYWRKKEMFASGLIRAGLMMWEEKRELPEEPQA
jgi:hypothetical protein